MCQKYNGLAYDMYENHEDIISNIGKNVHTVSG